MYIQFRQGIVSPSANFLNLNGSNNVDLVVSGSPVVITIAQQGTNYIAEEGTAISNAWIGPFSGSNKYWLYFNYDLETFSRTFGYTTLQPIAQSTPPLSGNDNNGIAWLTTGRMWFNTSTFTNYYYTGASWVQCLRVFAAYLNNGTFVSMGTNSAPNLTGTQVGANTSVYAGRVLFDDSSIALHHADGTFLTTEDLLFANSTAIDAIRLESNVITAACDDSAIAAYTPVAFKSDGGVSAAQYTDIGATVIAIATQNMVRGGTGAVIAQGAVTNLAWNWLSQTHSNGASVQVGDELWILNGTLVVDDPHVTNAITYPVGQVPVARVLTTNTIIFDQGLGGKGDTGPAGTVSNIAIGAVSTSSALAITGSPAPANGTLFFALDGELEGLGALASLGLVARTGSGVYVPRTLTPGSSAITITNGAGTSGNPTIDVNQSVLNLASMSGVLPITLGGTGATTQSGAANAVLPAQSGNTGKYLYTDGTNVSWSLTGVGTGTVTSITVSGSTGLAVSGSPITTSGTIALTLGTELQGLSALSANGVVERTGSGTYTTVSTVPLSLGGTGASTQSGAANNVLPAQVGNSGLCLVTDGSNVSWANRGTVSEIVATASGAGLIITGSPITTSGTLTFTLGSDLQALSALTTTGLVARTAPSTYTPVTLTSGTASTISVTNGAGVGGNPTISFVGAGVTSLPNLYVSESQVTTDGTSGGTSLVTLLAQKQPNIQFENSGSTVGTTGGVTSVNFSTGLTAAVNGSVLTVSTVPVYYSIVDVFAAAGNTSPAPSFTIIGDETTTFQSGFQFNVVGSAHNDGTYITVSSHLASPNTVIYVQETISSNVVDGSIYVGPGQGTVTSVNVTGGTGITATGGPIISSGVISLSLSTELQGLSALNSTGLVERTGTGTYTAISSVPINLGGTGATSATGAINALLPSQTGNSGKILSTNGTDVSWATAGSGSGSVTSVAVSSATNALTITGSPITSSGTITIQANTFGSATSGVVPASGGGTANFLRADGTWAAPSGSGTVTSVAVSSSTGLAVSGSPITSSGTISLTLGTELQGLSGLSTTGLIQRTGTATYSTVTSSSSAGTLFDYIAVASATTNVTLTNTVATQKTSTRSYIQVFLNGVLQREDIASFPNSGSFYVATSSQLTFANSLAVNDEVIVYQLFGV